MKKPPNSPQLKAWFKRYQRDGIYNFYEVVGGSGKTPNGYLTAIHFLSDPPRITVQHNFEHDRSGLTGTWCHYEASESITEAEYTEALNRALDCPGTVIV
jgi:hypothetical protein